MTPNNERHFIDWLIAALGVLLAILLFFLVRQYQILRRESIISARESWLMNALKNHPHLMANDTGAIRSWMTFDYLNKLFNLPPDYLKTQLSVTNPAYPRLTIGTFAKDVGQPASSTLTKIQNDVRQYLANPLPANTSST
jgi:hypothetical protein